MYPMTFRICYVCAWGWYHWRGVGEGSNDGVVLVCADQLSQIAFDESVNGFSSWHKGIRDMGVFQPFFHDQRKGMRACSPFTGSS
jgi:hypothetical protein